MNAAPTSIRPGRQAGITQWLSRDPLGEGADATLYSYVWNNPACLVDPLGLAGGKGNPAPPDPNAPDVVAQDQAFVNSLTVPNLSYGLWQSFNLNNFLNGNALSMTADWGIGMTWKTAVVKGLQSGSCPAIGNAAADILPPVALSLIVASTLSDDLMQAAKGVNTYGPDSWQRSNPEAAMWQGIYSSSANHAANNVW